MNAATADTLTQTVRRDLPQTVITMNERTKSTTTRFCKDPRKAREVLAIDELHASGSASKAGQDAPWIGKVRVRLAAADGTAAELQLDTLTAAEFALDLLEAVRHGRGLRATKPSDFIDHPAEPLPAELEARLIEAAAWVRPQPALAASARAWPVRPPVDRAAWLVERHPASAAALAALAAAPDHGIIGGWRRLAEVPGVTDETRDHLAALELIEVTPLWASAGRVTPDGLAVATWLD